MTKSKKIGITLILFCPVLLFIILGGYAVATFFLTKSSSTPLPEVESSINDTGTRPLRPSETDIISKPDVRVTAGKMVRVLLGLAGMGTIFGIIVLTPAGIYFLARKEPEATPTPPATPPTK